MFWASKLRVVFWRTYQGLCTLREHYLLPSYTTIVKSCSRWYTSKKIHAAWIGTDWLRKKGHIFGLVWKEGRSRKIGREYVNTIQTHCMKHSAHTFFKREALDMIVSFNPIICKAEAGGFLCVWSQSRLQRESYRSSKTTHWGCFKDTEIVQF